MEQTHEICPYPECTLDLYHDGDHHIGRPEKPRGLRMVQLFNPHFVATSWRIRCQIHAHTPPALGPAEEVWAAGLYQDEFGFGWELCEECATKGGAVHELPGPRPVDKAVVSVQKSAPNNRRANGRRLSVVR